jgi:hypothetical protein
MKKLRLSTGYFNSFFVIGRLKKTSQHNANGEKNLEKHSIDLFTLDFFGVVFLVLGENI